MNYRESALLIDCEGDEMVAILSEPVQARASLGVLVVVGGPQYRVGSHRQFVRLARRLAAAGIACMRFDVRGMGDASGDERDFEATGADIRAALDAFVARVPALSGVVLWGLCDGASAACLYAPQDRRVAGLVLLNPWVRTTAGAARTYLRHYYLKRVFDAAFWAKLLRGGVSPGRALAGVLDKLREARGKPSASPGASVPAPADGLPQRMVDALVRAGLPLLVVLSGRDYVAREFEQVVADDPRWQCLMENARVVRMAEADHTFSDLALCDDVSGLTASWVDGLVPGRSSRGVAAGGGEG